MERPKEKPPDEEIIKLGFESGVEAVWDAGYEAGRASVCREAFALGEVTGKLRLEAERVLGELRRTEANAYRAALELLGREADAEGDFESVFDPAIELLREAAEKREQLRTAEMGRANPHAAAVEILKRELDAAEPFDPDSGGLDAAIHLLGGETGPGAACDHKFVDSVRCLKCGWVPPDGSQAGKSPCVHILRHGNALCGLRGPPVDWPDGHTWVALTDENRNEATCLECRAEAWDGSQAREEDDRHGWTHPMCDACWSARRTGEPVRLMQPEAAMCCFCGGKAVGGIFVRERAAECGFCPDNGGKR